MMGLLSSVSFVTPQILLALLALPIIWWLLRATPPRPQQIAFPPLRLLLQVLSRENQTDKTPWWLLLLRLTIVALIIVASAHPYFSENTRQAASHDPLLLIVDDDWGAARDWAQRESLMKEILQEAQNNAVSVTLLRTAPNLQASDLSAAEAKEVAQQLATVSPSPLTAERLGALEKLSKIFSKSEGLHVVWLSNGLNQSEATRFVTGLQQLAQGQAQVEVALPDLSRLPITFKAINRQDGHLKLTLQRSLTTEGFNATVTALARDGRSLKNISVVFAKGQGSVDVSLDLPIELQNQIAKFTIAEAQASAATLLMDDRWRQKTIALEAGTSLEQAQPLLSPLYYVTRALAPTASLSEPKNLSDLEQMIKNGLSMLIMADIGTIGESQIKLLKPWIDQGGVLLRFAGPKFANSQDELVPVRLRAGGRDLGSALSWEKPQHLQEFSETSPFHGLAAEGYVTVSRQVLAEPGPELNEHVWASLGDGTPLITARRQGKGLIVLVHTTANADWSNLSLSGLFVSLLQRLTDLSPAAGMIATGDTPELETEALGVKPFKPVLVLSGSGEALSPSAELKPLSPADMEKASPTPTSPPGLYSQGRIERAINLFPESDEMVAITELPAGANRLSYSVPPRLDLTPYLFALALLLFLGDCVVSLAMRGSLNKMRHTVPMLLLLLFTVHAPLNAQAQSLTPQQAAADFRLAYVKTGDATADQTSEAGLKGLSELLKQRTAVEPAAPVAIDLEKDDIVFYPLLYWRITEGSVAPSSAVVEKMDRYMKNGGILFFDLGDGSSEFDAATPATLALRNILSQLNIPPLEKVPPGHVLTRSFYLLKDFPGRYSDGSLWVEQMLPNADNVRDGVSAILIGSNDYAAAWAVDEDGAPLYATVPAGDDTIREMANRVGINIVMYALTGNYKTDQLHSKALIERLGIQP